VVVGPIACFGASFIMDRRDAALLRVHERNIDKYQRLLKTKLSEAEVHYLQKRLSEERLSVVMLQFKEHPDRP
jgi:5-bromo-4-chloroindolyl phosphate hydrolysis protein